MQIISRLIIYIDQLNTGQGPLKKRHACISAIQCIYADATLSLQICLRKAMHIFPLHFSFLHFNHTYILCNIPSNLEFIPNHLRGFPLYSEIVISKVIEYAIEP